MRFHATRTAFLRILGLSALLLALLTHGPTPLQAQGNGADFKDPLNGAPLTLPLKPGETETPVLQKFKATGVNGYRGDAQALLRGQALYEQWCQVCHNADASGKMGPALIGKTHIYPQTASDAGMFSIIYVGATGAMQPFSKRDISQDEILQVIAYVRSLDR
ncbi:MAG: c-type cytochrome [Burkholderiaceae bacterium]